MVACGAALVSLLRGGGVWAVGELAQFFVSLDA